MRNTGVFDSRSFHRGTSSSMGSERLLVGPTVSRKMILGLLLVVALFAFEVFNFDTTRFALRYLLGEANFWGIHWATILAIAFCAIDFAGLARLFTPEQGKEEPRAVWYLMGAWLLGATMNAIMTWWAVSLTLLSHDFGNEVLSRQQLLQAVPVFVAALVWLTRILFIGALSVAGEHILDSAASRARVKDQRTVQPASEPAEPRVQPNSRPRSTVVGQIPHTRQRVDQSVPISPRNYPMPAGMQARSRRR